MVTEQEIVNVLNDFLEKDPSSMMELFSLLVPTSFEMIEDYEVIFSKKENDYPEIGFIAILNKIIENSGKKIKFNYKFDPISMELEPSRFSLIDI